MAYKIQLINDHAIVKIRHQGIVDVSEMNTCKDLAIIHLKRLVWNKVLIDIKDAEFQVGTLDIAKLYKDLDNTFPDRAFIAILQPTKMDFDYGQYSKSIANEWSNAKVEIFNKENSALSWLTNVSDGT